MTDWLQDPLNLSHDAARPTTRTILLRLCTPWPYMLVGTAVVVDASLKVARIIDDALGDLRP